MAEIFKQLGYGSAPNSEGAATVVQGVGTVPAGKRWNAKVIIHNTGGSSRTVTCGFHPSDTSLVVGEFLLSAESLSSKARQEFGIRSMPAGYVFRMGQATADADVQWEIVGYEVDI